jgi:formiminotetrahydrofolate cyclodeaminase
MPSKNERAELEMQIMKHRQLTSRITDEEFLKRLEEKIAELEQKLHEIDDRAASVGPP